MAAQIAEFNTGTKFTQIWLPSVNKRNLLTIELWEYYDTEYSVQTGKGKESRTWESSINEYISSILQCCLEVCTWWWNASKTSN